MSSDIFVGVFATRTQNKNPAAARLDIPNKFYWFVWKNNEGYKVQLLNAQLQPAEAPVSLSVTDFKLNGFEPQPHVLVTPHRQQAVQAEERTTIYNWKEATSKPTEAVPTPKAKQTAPTAVLEKPSPSVVLETAQAKQPPTVNIARAQKALELDFDSRSRFALAMKLWRQGDKRTSLNTFKKLLRLKDNIMPAHKHMFADFAKTLRKNALLSLSCEHCERVVELAPNDPNARFNLARAYYEINEPLKAFEELQYALKLAPNFKYAKKFKAFLLKKFPKIQEQELASKALDDFFPLKH